MSAEGIRGRLLISPTFGDKAYYKGTPFISYKQIYFCEGYYVSLCIMNKGPTTYLKTETSTLTRSAINKIAKETINYCVQTLGTKSALELPAVSVVKRGRSRRYGQYDPIKNKIEIHYNICGDVKMLIRTIIHEYTHYMQNLKRYDILYSKFGYDKHPQEIEACMNEKLYSPCWKQIKHNI